MLSEKMEFVTVQYYNGFVKGRTDIFGYFETSYNDVGRRVNDD